MRDIVITSKQIRNESITFLVCFAISFLSNIGAIIFYKSPVTELLSSLHYVLLFAAFIYLVWGIIRLLKIILFKIIARKKM
jgi:hypothetical protein